MRLRELTAEELAQVYDRDLREAFPPQELKPLHAMEKMRERGAYAPLCAVDDGGEMLGYAFLWKHQGGGYVLLDYLCVPARLRNGGIGAKILQAVLDYYPAGIVLLAESEAPVGDPERDRMILRRLDFYVRSGASALNYECVIFDVHYKMFCWAESVPTEEEIMVRHREIYRQQLKPALYDRYVQIPREER